MTPKKNKTCRHCGLVPIFAGVPATVDGCPWCFNRIKGLPMPMGQIESLEVKNVHGI